MGKEYGGTTNRPDEQFGYGYDGMVVIQERQYNPQVSTTAPQLVVTYTRGRDLSGSLQGAGGIGGLLARTESGPLAAGGSLATVFHHADNVGNVMALPMFPPVLPQPDWSGNNNCYNYVMIAPCKLGWPPTLYPGDIAGLPRPDKWTCEEVERLVRADGAESLLANGTCPEGYHKTQFFVGLHGTEFHFQMENNHGSWSEKPNNLDSPRLCNPDKPYKPKGDQQPYEKCPHKLCLPDSGPRPRGNLLK